MKLVLGAWESPILTPDLNAGHLTAKPSAAAAAAPLHLPTPVTASGVKEEEEVEEDSFKKGGAESSSSSEKMILPLAKLGTLALKMMSKPIAIRLKSEASRHPRFRHLIINLAQANHRISTNIQRRIYGHSTNVEIRPLNEEKAVQAAADLIGELFVFS